jgi:tetrahydromethanopterin S-methyltransferase subunit D
LSPQLIRQVCFTVGIVSIVLGTLTGIAMIWLELHKGDTAWKFFLTFFLLALASMLALGVTRNVGKDS